MASKVISFIADICVSARDAYESMLPSELRTERKARRWERKWQEENGEQTTTRIGTTPKHANLFDVGFRKKVVDEESGQIYYVRDVGVAGEEPWDTSSLSNTKYENIPDTVEGGKIRKEMEQHLVLFHSFLRQCLGELKRRDL